MSASLGFVIPDYLLKTPAEGGIVNLPSIIIILLLCSVLIRGTKQSAKLNFALILVALAAIIAFVVTAAPHANPDNLNPFAPFGVRGIFSGASIVFFSYMASTPLLLR